MDMNTKDEITRDYYNLHWEVGDVDGKVLGAQQINLKKAEDELINVLNRAKSCDEAMYHKLLNDAVACLFLDMDRAYESRRTMLAKRYSLLLFSVIEELLMD